MENKNYQLFNICNTPLQETCLIESSAGTGKTFTISLLYLRILLGINTQQYYFNQILVVTFNKSAQQELLYRIKSYIQDLKICCIKKKIHKTSILKTIFEQIKNFSQAYNILTIAENQILDAPIYTIDAFLKKILSFNIFKFNLINKKKILLYNDTILLQATILYWRKYFYSIPMYITYIIYKIFHNPQTLLKKIYKKINYINKKKYFYHNIYYISLYCRVFYNKLKKIKKFWLLEEYNILYQIKYSNVNKKKYTKINLLKWIKIISLWAKITDNTQKYFFPIELKYFQEKNLNLIKIIFKNKIFKKIQELLNIFIEIKNMISYHAISNIQITIKKIKKQDNLITFDEISKKIYFYIKKYKYSIKILKKYPIVCIDEFQDMNNNQFKIFNEIYIKNHAPIILIGDPKQSIYSFRNANIFNYLIIKKNIKQYYSLSTNWRCSKKINDGINFLFHKMKYPFILKNLYFIPTQSPPENKNIYCYIKKEKYSGLSLIYCKKKKNIKEFQNWISEKCAKNISYWLKHIEKKQAFIKKNNIIQKIKYEDIVILVRNTVEAEIIKNQLNILNISSIYIPQQNNIYHSNEAYEILLILKALINLENINLIKKACFTNMIGMSFNNIFKISYDLNQLLSITKKFQKYYNVWKKYGILNLLKMIIVNNNNNLLNINIENIIYLGTLLQKKSVNFIKNDEIIIWFENIISKKENSQYNSKYSIPIQESIKILSIHYSKGLEYPIVWIPFGIYHIPYQKKNNQNTNNINQLSEEIRLLYVACTRAIIYCNIGITIFKKKNNDTNILNTALGYIIQNGQKMNEQQFHQEINKIKKYTCIKICSKVKEYTYLNKKKKNFFLLNTDQNNKEIKNIDNIQYNTSFTNIKKILDNQKKTILNNINYINKKLNVNIMNIHSFPQGKEYGILLHKILKKIKFSNYIDNKLLNSLLKKENISKNWVPILKQWLINIFNTPLKKKSQMKLINLQNHQYIKEVNFSIPIKKKITRIKLEKFIQNNQLNIKINHMLPFKKIDGIVHGTIDLIFLWEQKYYLIDYKSNWLGNNNSYYTKQAIQNEILQKKYFLQYQIYSLALHKYLKKKIYNYSFSKNFGGIFYIFIRSIEKDTNNQGIFFYLPKKSFINSFNTLIN